MVEEHAEYEIKWKIEVWNADEERGGALVELCILENCKRLFAK